MSIFNQKGAVHIIGIIFALILLVGVGVGIYLSQQGTIFKSRASKSESVIFVDSDDQKITETSSSKVRVLVVPSTALDSYTGSAKIPSLISEVNAQSKISNVRGVVYVDGNGNQKYDSGEKVVENAEVRLSQSAVKTTKALTNSGGIYRFENVTQGSYRITLVMPSGYTRVSDDSFVFNLDADKEFNFIVKPEGTSKGGVENTQGLGDSDKGRRYNLQEVVMAEDPSFNTNVVKVGSDSMGMSGGFVDYKFSSDSPGKKVLFVKFIFKETKGSSTISVEGYPYPAAIELVSGGSGGAQISCNFSVTPTTISLEGKATFTLKTENAPSGATATWVGFNGNKPIPQNPNFPVNFSESYTGNQFGGEGKYTRAIDIVKDGNILCSTNEVYTTVDNGKSFLDPRDTPKIRISGKAFIDVNKDGSRDGNDRELANAEIVLSEVKTGRKLDSRITNSEGNYEFTDLNAGSYRVTLIVPSGYSRSTDDSVQVYDLTTDKELDFGVKQ